MKFMLGIVVGVSVCAAAMQAGKPSGAPALPSNPPTTAITPATPTKPVKPAAPAQGAEEKPVRLGNFSVSLSVKDLAASKAFYEKLGLRMVAGNGKNMAIMQNDAGTIGLFQGMFEKNTLTFNPGWDRSGATLADFDDVRDVQRALKAKGVTLVTSADEAGTGPASFLVVDPDGNPVLVDQHVPRPTK
jgi:catechol 2,3-dioxygenase-like lactoylglutathione lyase family enzyme